MPRTPRLRLHEGLRGRAPKYGRSCCVPSALHGNVCSMFGHLIATSRDIPVRTSRRCSLAGNELVGLWAERLRGCWTRTWLRVAFWVVCSA
jgi:hypothetical protein